MKKILWLSRHSPTAKQLAQLGQVMGDFELTQQIPDFPTRGEDAADAIASLMEELGAVDLVCSLSVQHLAALSDRGIQPLRAIMKREISHRRDGLGDIEYDYVFEKFERIIQVKYIATDA